LIKWIKWIKFIKKNKENKINKISSCPSFDNIFDQKCMDASDDIYEEKFIQIFNEAYLSYINGINSIIFMNVI